MVFRLGFITQRVMSTFVTSRPVRPIDIPKQWTRLMRRDFPELSHTSRMRRFAILAVAFLLTSPLSSTVLGQAEAMKAKSFRDRVVDKATLVDGTQLWGMAISEKPAKLLMRTSWLKANNADFYTSRIVPELKNVAQPATSKLADSLQKEIEQLQRKNRNDDQQRIGLLTEIRDRLIPDNATDPDFVIVEFPKSQLRKLETQTAARRELCRLAMLSRVQDLEELHWRSVAEQLPANASLPPQVANSSPAEPADQNRADYDRADYDRDRILAAVDLRLNAATRLIQSGDTFQDESAQLDLAALVNSMLGGNIQSLLNELLNEGTRAAPKAAVGNTLPEPAIRIAELQKRDTVVLRGFEFDLAAGSATVTRRLFRKSDQGQWNVVLAAMGTSTAADLKAGQVEAIESDPQIREISGLVQGLGLGNEQFSNALRMGAVVRNAMNLADKSFEDGVQSFITTRGLSQPIPTPTIRIAERL